MLPPASRAQERGSEDTSGPRAFYLGFSDVFQRLRQLPSPEGKAPAVPGSCANLQLSKHSEEQPWRDSYHPPDTCVTLAGLRVSASPARRRKRALRGHAHPHRVGAALLLTWRSPGTARNTREQLKECESPVHTHTELSVPVLSQKTPREHGEADGDRAWVLLLWVSSSPASRSDLRQMRRAAPRREGKDEFNERFLQAERPREALCLNNTSLTPKPGSLAGKWHAGAARCTLHTSGQRLQPVLAAQRALGKPITQPPSHQNRGPRQVESPRAPNGHRLQQLSPQQSPRAVGTEVETGCPR